MRLPHRPARFTFAFTISVAALGCNGGGDNVTVPPTTGTLEITTSTSGTEQDADGYSVEIDAELPRAIGATGSLTVTDVTAGSHTVRLGEVAGNCLVSGDNPRTASITADETATLDFSVTCGATTGSIQVTIVTTGSSVDPDGYTVSVDGGAAQAVGSNATLTLEGLAPGAHALALSGIAINCHLEGQNPRTVEVLQSPTAVTFDLDCLGANALIAFTSSGLQLQAILTVNSDGSGLRNLTPDGEFESNPTWSPDGRKILFSKEDDLYVMNTDGSGRTKLADGDQGIFEHRWSPDGRMIAYVDSRAVGQDLVDDLWVVQADGTGKVRVAEQAFNFSWSQDGRIVYTSEADLAHVHLRIVNADGSGDVLLTDRAAFQPAWSPDGTRIAFVTLGDKDVFLINPDGTGEVNLTQGLSNDDGPSWSPDGSRIAFAAEPLGQPLESEVAVMNRDGSGRLTLTNRPGFDFQPVWSPDGSRIVFVGSEISGDSEIYVMNADGGSQTNLSNRADTRETTPDWNGQGAVTVASRQSAFYRRWLQANRQQPTGPGR